jgi:hypothetical protein
VGSLHIARDSVGVVSDGVLIRGGDTRATTHASGGSPCPAARALTQDADRSARLAGFVWDRFEIFPHQGAAGHGRDEHPDRLFWERHVRGYASGSEAPGDDGGPQLIAPMFGVGVGPITRVGKHPEEIMPPREHAEPRGVVGPPIGVTQS